MTPLLAPALVSILGQSALKSLLLGAAVFVVLRLVRLRDLRAETAIWTAVLVAALAMPVLGTILPGFGLRLPSLPHAPVAAAPAPMIGGRANPSLDLTSLGLIATGVYLLGAAAVLLRILAGLVLAAALYVRAAPVAEPWARGKAIRASAAVDGPLSFARCILLPADYRSWPQAKLAAVLAHEECHIRRGDFFIQLLASVHRALFWFSPFPWWLQRKLGELAETASDAAGAHRIGDPAGYAEILIDVTRSARSRSPSAAALAQGTLAMAHGPGLAKRVDHILMAPPERALGAAPRALALAAVTGAALVLAGAHAATALAQVSAHAPVPTGPRSPSPHAVRRHVPSRPAQPGVATRALPVKTTAAPSALTPQPAVAETTSYDPLALLRDNDTVAILPVVLTHGVTE